MLDLSPLPTVTVTFLFSDVEGSTRLLNAHPDQDRLAVRRHHDLLLEAVRLAGGTVFETVGDTVYNAFQSLYHFTVGGPREDARLGDAQFSTFRIPISTFALLPAGNTSRRECF